MDIKQFGECSSLLPLLTGFEIDVLLFFVDFIRNQCSKISLAAVLVRDMSFKWR